MQQYPQGRATGRLERFLHFLVCAKSPTSPDRAIRTYRVYVREIKLPVPLRVGLFDDDSPESLSQYR